MISIAREHRTRINARRTTSLTTSVRCVSSRCSPAPQPARDSRRSTHGSASATPCAMAPPRAHQTGIPFAGVQPARRAPQAERRAVPGSRPPHRRGASACGSASKKVESVATFITGAKRIECRLECRLARALRGCSCVMSRRIRKKGGRSGAAGWLSQCVLEPTALLRRVLESLLTPCTVVGRAGVTQSKVSTDRQRGRHSADAQMPTHSGSGMHAGEDGRHAEDAAWMRTQSAAAPIDRPFSSTAHRRRAHRVGSDNGVPRTGGCASGAS